MNARLLRTVLAFLIGLGLSEYAAAQQFTTTTNRPSVGVLLGPASRLGDGKTGFDAGIVAELPARAFRVRGEIGSTWLRSSEDEAAITIRRASIGVLRLLTLEPARPFVGAGIGLYRYASDGLPNETGSAGYLTGGFEIAREHLGFSVELRLTTAPREQATSARPWHAALLAGIKRVF